ncbi:hypothetical protein F1880_004630 [Penicillium rolfsii]|nr:hypothetical protein F1880_004630 [Penicillium rolfsii]
MNYSAGVGGREGEKVQPDHGSWLMARCGSEIESRTQPFRRPVNLNWPRKQGTNHLRREDRALLPKAIARSAQKEALCPENDRQSGESRWSLLRARGMNPAGVYKLHVARVWQPDFGMRSSVCAMGKNSTSIRRI